MRHFNQCNQMLGSLKDFSEALVASDAAEVLAASQKAALLQQAASQALPVAEASPYFKPQVPDAVDDDDVVVIPTAAKVQTPPHKKSSIFSTLLGHSNRIRSRLPPTQSPVELSEDESEDD